MLKTKLFIPKRRSAILHRNRLTDKLDNGVESKLTFVCAPAGFGKTTLLVDWISKNTRPAAWISLDQTENQPVCFFKYVTGALQTIDRNLGKSTISMLSAYESFSVESIAANLINEILEFKTDFLLILDDFHIIDNPDVYSVVAFFIDHMPENMHLAISSRADLPFPVTRLKLENQVTEIRSADLCFNLEEIALFFNEIMRLNLQDREIEVMASKTEGWIAGLQLAGLSMEGDKDISRFINDFTGNNRHVIDYLAEEVLNRQPDHIQQFLFHSSILSRFCADLCDAVTERDDSRDILAELERINLFLIPLDDQRFWFRYHHLFGELMRQRLLEKDPGALNDINLKASRWFEAHGEMEDAVNHALAAACHDRAARLIEKHVQTDWQGGERGPLYEWFGQIPEEIIHSRPDVMLTRARVLFERGLHEKARKDLDKLEHTLASSSQTLPPEKCRVVRGKIAAVRSHMASREGNIQGIEKTIETALALLPEKEPACRAVVALASGVVNNIKGDYAAALKDHSRAMSEAWNAGNTYLFLIARLWKILDLKNIGRLPEAISLCQKLMKQVENKELSFLVAKGHVYGTWGELLYELNRLDEAEQFEQKGVDFLEQGYDANHFGWRLTILFKILCARQKINQARNLLPKMENLMETVFISPWIATQIRAARARLWLINSNKAALLQWISDCGLQVDGEYTILQEAENIMHSRILLHQGRLADALAVTDRLLIVQEKSARILNQIETLIIKSLILKKMQKSADSANALVQALTLAQPGGYVRVFVDEGRPLAELIETIDEFNSQPVKNFAEKLLTEFKTAKFEIHTERLIEPLSGRELEVLRLLSAGLSNKRITDELFISPNTVKTHLKNIYGKLSVHSRAEAILKAQELDLL